MVLKCKKIQKLIKESSYLSVLPSITHRNRRNLEKKKKMVIDFVRTEIQSSMLKFKDESYLAVQETV